MRLLGQTSGSLALCQPVTVSVYVRACMFVCAQWKPRNAMRMTVRADGLWCVEWRQESPSPVLNVCVCRYTRENVCDCGLYKRYYTSVSIYIQEHAYVCMIELQQSKDVPASVHVCSSSHLSVSIPVCSKTFIARLWSDRITSAYPSLGQSGTAGALQHISPPVWFHYCTSYFIKPNF